MRFTSNGPDFPDALLRQRDEGNVVFLCGAGVSIPSGLPSFESLTKNVISKLSPSQDSQIYNAIQTWNKREDSTEKHYKVPLDQIFNDLQQDYGRDYIGNLVAEFLSTSEKDKFTSYYHEVISRISVNEKGDPQIVTTNFDHLFEKVDKLKSARRYLPPSTPEIQHGVHPTGITYLHGRLNDTATESHNYVLSSSDFGKAYLSQAWATNFVKQLLQKYVVVLLGYSAEDPPIKYLLQGLNSGQSINNRRIYAFDMGEEASIEKKWAHLGVNVIAYPETPDHKSLWESLEKWADKSEFPLKWQRYVVELAQQDPKELKAYERGIVTSFVNDPLGAQIFSKTEPKPHPEWICVFDPYVRIAGGITRPWGDKATFTPVEHYGLDSDCSTKKNQNDKNPFLRAKSALSWNKEEEKSVKNLNVCNSGVTILPNRIKSICSWIANSVNSPVIAWWLARQDSLHPELLRVIKICTDNTTNEKAKILLTQILEAIEHKLSPDSNYGLYQVLRKIKGEGWNRINLIALKSVTQPFFSLERPYGLHSVRPPTEDWDSVSIHSITALNVKLPQHIEHIGDIEDKDVLDIFRVLNESMRQAAEMYKEIDAHWHNPIHLYPPSETGTERSYNPINKYAKLFRELIDRLSIMYPENLKAFVINWPDNTYLMSIFKLYAFNQNKLYSPIEITEQVRRLPKGILWSSFCSQELLYLLRDNWLRLTHTQQDIICARLLNEESDSDNIDLEENEYETAKKIELILWLEKSHVNIPQKWLDKTKQIKHSLTDWYDQWIDNTISKGGIKSATYTVQIKDCSSELRNVAVNRILQKCQEISEQKSEAGRTEPFHGVVKDTPKRALLAILQETNKGDVWEYWRILIDEWPIGVPNKQTSLLLRKLLELPQNELFKMRYTIQRRFDLDFRHLVLADTDFAFFVFDSLLNTIRTAKDFGKESNQVLIVDGGPFSGYQDAKHSFVGEMTTALLNALYTLSKKGTKNIPIEFKQQIEKLLISEGELDRNSLCILAIHTNSLMKIDLQWTKEVILPHFKLKSKNWEYAWHSIIQKAGGWLENFKFLELLKEDFIEFTQIVGKLNWSDDVKNEVSKWCIQSIALTDAKAPSLDAFQVKSLLRRLPEKQLIFAIDFLVGIGCEVDNGWRDRVIPLLKNAWPRENHCKSESVTIALIRLLGRSGDFFPDLFDTVALLLVPISNYNIDFYTFHESSSEENLTLKFPHETIKMLDLILQDSIQSIPYGVDQIMKRLVQADQELENDLRYRRLQKLIVTVGCRYQ